MATSRRARIAVFFALLVVSALARATRADIEPPLCQHPTNSYCTQTCGSLRPCDMFIAVYWPWDKRQFGIWEESTFRPAGFENMWTNHMDPALSAWTHGAISFIAGTDIVLRYVLDEDDWPTDKFSIEWVNPIDVVEGGKRIIKYVEINLNCFNYGAGDFNVNSTGCEAGKFDIRAILVHEIGHVLLMRDCVDVGAKCLPNVICTVMNNGFARSECVQGRQKPTALDLAGVDCLYPPIPPAIFVDTTWGHIKDLYRPGSYFNGSMALSGEANTIVWNRKPNPNNFDYWVYRSKDDSDVVDYLGSTSGWDSVFVDNSAVAGTRYKYHVASSDGGVLTEVGTPSAGLKLVKDHIFNDAWNTAFGDDAKLAVRGSIVYAALEVSGGFEIRKLDASNPQSLVELGRRSGLQWVQSICLSEDGARLYVQTITGFLILNAAQNNLPILGQIQDIVSGSGVSGDIMEDMAVDDDIVFLACGAGGVKAIAVDRPGLPSVVGTFDPDGAFVNGKLLGDVQMNRGSLYATEQNQDGSGVRCDRLSVDREYSSGHLSTVSFQLECTSYDATCWSDFSAGTSMVGRVQDGTFDLQLKKPSAHPFTIVNTLTAKSEAIRSVDAPAVGAMWVLRDTTGVPIDTLKFFSTFESYDFDSRFLYATTPMSFDAYDRELVAFDVWAVGVGSVYAGGDQLGSCKAGTVRSQGKYLYVLDDFRASGEPHVKPRLRIYEKASGCKPDPDHPVRVFPESEGYKLGQEIGISLAVGCPTSVHVELLQDGSVVGQVSTKTFAVADDIAHTVSWPVACSTTHLEDHAYSFRATATYPGNTSASFLSGPFSIEIGAKREVAIGGGKPFSSIQAAINASQSGDTVLVYAGNYFEVLTLKSNLRIIGKTGASIAVGNTNPAMSVSGAVFPPIVDGLEFHAINSTSTPAIMVSGSGIKVKNCSFNSLIRAVSIGSDSSTGHAEFTSCTFSSNHDPTGYGGALWLNSDGQASTLTDCQFINNSATVRGGAVYLGGANSYSSSTAQVSFVRCTFTGNSAPEAAAVRVGMNRRPSFDHCVFTGNHPTATSGGSVVGGAGGASATFTNCTFAANSNSSSYAVVSLEPGGTVPVPTIDWSIFSNNSGGNAFGVGTYAAKNCDFFGNSSGDATWAASGTGNFSENPAFCPAGNYSIYAFSPCAPGVKSTSLVGAKDIACAPNATVTVLPGGTNPPDNYLLVCPKGDGDSLAVQVTLDPNVMTRAPQARELTIQAPYASKGIYSNKAITSDISASSPNYVMRVGHKYLSGYTWLHLPIYLNGYQLAQQALIKRRSPDLTGAPGGTTELPVPNGKVELNDFARWNLGYSYSGHIVPYDSLCDIDANGTVGLSDFGRFCGHYGPTAGNHFQPFSLPTLQMTFPTPVPTSTASVTMSFTDEYVTAVDRRLNVDLTLEEATGATACLFAVKTNRSDLTFLDWANANPNILFANVNADSVEQLFVGVAYPQAYTKGKERLGRMTFDVQGTGPIEIGQNEFILTVGDIELMGPDNQTYGAQLSGVVGRTINGPVARLFHNRLEQNFPNPFNPQTTIAFSLSKRSNVHLAVYDVTGARVRDLVNETRVPGAYKVVWDGRSQNGNAVASGVYFYKLSAGDFTSAKKMVVLK